MIRNAKYMTKVFFSFATIAALCAACDDEEKESSCVEGKVVCEENALSICQDGAWKITICEEDTPICDVNSAGCLEDPEATCIPSKCELAENAAKMTCRFDQCVVKTCEVGFDVAEDKKSCQEHVECNEPNGKIEILNGKCHLISCHNGYIFDASQSHCIAEKDCSFIHGVAEISDGICMLSSCEDNYIKNESATECILPTPKLSCQALDGNVPIQVEHGNKACEGNTLKICNDGVLEADAGDCGTKVCRFDATSKAFGCYKAISAPACTVEDYLKTCVVENSASIDGCRSNGVCAYTCVEGYADSGSGCILLPNCTSTSVSLTDKLNTVIATGTATPDSKIGGAGVYCTTDLTLATRKWKGSIVTTENLSASEDGFLISASGDVLGEGDNYCVVAVTSPDNSSYFFCPVSASNTTAVYSSSASFLTEAQTIKVANTCGNGIIDAGEMCDGKELAGATCASVTANDKMSGMLNCVLCSLDASECAEQDDSVGQLIFSFKPALGCSEVVAVNNGISADGCSYDEATGKSYSITYDAGYDLSISANGKVNSNINLYASSNYIKLSSLPANIVIKAQLTSTVAENELGVKDNGSVPKSAVWKASSDKAFYAFAPSQDATEVMIQPTASGNNKKVLVYQIDVFEAK